MFAKNWHQPLHQRRLTSFVALTALWLSFLFGLLPNNQPISVNAQGSSASHLLAVINSLRAANGMPALVTNNKLMAAAQVHSEYQASAGSVTHSGTTSSSPRDRAAAAGYGGDGTFYISDNIAGGSNLTAGQAVGWWQADASHLNTMLDNSYGEVGVGVAVSGSTVFYTLDLAYVPRSSSVTSGASAQTTALPGNLPGNPTATLDNIQPVQAATPASDGSITHVVEQGQNLITIAQIYKIPLIELFALNNLTDQSVIYPGEKLLIKAADRTPEPIPSETTEPTTPPAPTSTPTRRPTRTPHPAVTEGSAMTLSSETNPTLTAPNGIVAQNSSGEGQVVGKVKKLDPMLLVIGGLISFGALMILLGTAFKRRG